MIRIALLLALLGLPCPAAAGLVWQVPGDFSTISAALVAAAPDDTIRVGSGTFAPSTNGESYPLAIPDGITLIGAGMQMSGWMLKAPGGWSSSPGPGPPGSAVSRSVVA